MNFKKSVLAIVVGISLGGAAFAQESHSTKSVLDGSTVDGPANFGVYAVAGSGGYGLGLIKHISPNFGIRAEALAYSYNGTYNQNAVTYDVAVKLRDSGVYADYRPFAGMFRVVGGVMINTPSASMSAQPTGGVFTLNGIDYSAAGESISSTIKFPSSMPYVGIGWGYGGYNKKGFSVGVDIGASIGKPSFTYTASSGLTTLAGSDLQAEADKIRKDVEKIKFYPGFKVGVSYAF